MKKNLTYLFVCLFLFSVGVSFTQHTQTGAVFDAGINTTLSEISKTKATVIDGDFITVIASRIA
ncbi:hypothetical protein SLH46_01115 [Draconibacterium sp. IB214405]|uniref:hypothetical protein n=1 Tax=Draconibacterium sp. IB214405 TaxID=3097352 RepID=UPI002A12A5F6|nr:hypothetical protein [Draconibacterium sp. IB214405]MDX8337761.1 hypothetical protein [Draconibacterium sp. IB214405]